MWSPAPLPSTHTCLTVCTTQINLKGPQSPRAPMREMWPHRMPRSSNPTARRQKISRLWCRNAHRQIVTSAHNCIQASTRLSYTNVRQVCFGVQIGPSTARALFLAKGNQMQLLGRGLSVGHPRTKPQIPKTQTNHPALIIMK